MQLVEYCRRVASAVGLICIEIFGCRDAAAREYAINLGLALQLTNIIRDVGVDLARGRVYLPQEDLARFNCTVDDLRRGVVTPAGARRSCRSRSRAHGSTSRWPRSRCAAPMPVAWSRPRSWARFIRKFCAASSAADYNVFSQVIRVPRPARAVIAITTWMKTIAISLQREGLHWLTVDDRR